MPDTYMWLDGMAMMWPPKKVCSASAEACTLMLRVEASTSGFNAVTFPVNVLPGVASVSTRTAIARFNTTTARIDSLVAGAQRGEGTVGKLITDESLYNNVNNLSSEGVKMIYDFRQNPKKYLTIKFQLF